MIIFKPQDHKYESIDPSENISWTSVTSLVGRFKNHFDAPSQALKSSKNKKSKWYGLDPQLIQDIWKNETTRAVEAGSWYHDQRENELLQHDSLQRMGIDLPIIKPIYENGIKKAPVQKLEDGIYPEHMVYLKSAGICGQADRIEIVGNQVDIYDYKTNKEIKKQSYKSWDGITTKMAHPLSHLDDCNLIHYSLQLSIYMYIILKHNPRLRPGVMFLHHIIFETDGEDQYGYPINSKDYEGNPIVKEVVPYAVPYLKEEVISLINYIKDAV